MANDENGLHVVNEDEEIGDQFILVLDPTDNDPVEILLSKDQTLPISSLEHAFPGAHGLKYKNPSTGGKRIVSFDDNKKAFVAPSDGWGGKLFDVIFQPKVPPIVSVSSDNDVKTEPFEKEPIPIANLKRKSDSESSNNNKKVLKKDNNLLVEELDEKPNNFNEENKEHHEGGSEYKEEFISKGSTRSGNFELPPAAVERVPSDLIVFGLPYELDDWEFREYFEQFGAVEYEEIKRKPNGGSRGFAFVRMINYLDQVRALSVPIHTIGGRECVIKMSALDKGKSDSFENISVNPRLYIGNLGGDVGKERLREYLQEHLYRFDKRATINEIFYPNPFRHFSFVTVTSAVAARELLKQHDFFIDGHYFMLTLAMPRKGEETTPGIIAPPVQNQRGNGWFPKQGPQQIVGPPPRGPPPPVIDNWPRQPEVYWNNYPPSSVQHPQLPPQQIKKPPVFGAYAVRSNEDYMPRGGGVPADYVLPPRGERGYVYNNQIQRPHPSTCDQSAFPPVGVGAGFTRKPRSPSFDPREEMLRSMPFGNQQKLGRSDNYDSWVGGESNSSGGPSLMNPNDAEAVLNKLPNDAVSTALRMLQSIMTAQQQKERLYDGRNEEEGNQR